MQDEVADWLADRLATMSSTEKVEFADELRVCADQVDTSAAHDEPEYGPIYEAAELASLVFEAAGWEWGWRNGAHVPDTDEIATRLRELVDECPTGGGIGTGRFMVDKACPSDATPGRTTIYLELAQWDEWPE